MLREKFAADAKFELIEGDALEGETWLNEQLLAAIQSQSHTTKGQRSGWLLICLTISLRR